MGHTVGRKPSARSAAGLLSLAVLSCGPLSAQEKPDTSGTVTVEEIVVTATKRKEPLLDIPVAVTALSSDQILARGLTNYVDYLNTLPDVFVQDVGPGRTQLYIRGLVASGGVGFPVATYFGEAVTSVVTNDGGFSNLRLVDIDRVEVLRGPQGTLYGANSLAGVVRIVPNAPDLKDFQATTAVRGWSTDHSNNPSDHAEGVLNIPLLSQVLGLRVLAYQDYIAGYIDNVVPAATPNDYSAAFGAPPGTLVIPGHNVFTRRSINSENVWGARAAVTWRPSSDLHVDLTYTTQGDTLNAEPGASPAVGRFAVDRPLDWYARGEGKEIDRLGQAVVTYGTGPISLVSATGYTQVQRVQNRDISFLAQAGGLGPQLWTLEEFSDGHAFTEELRLTSRNPGSLQWLLGYFYSNSGFDFSQYVPDYSCPTCLPEVLAGQNFALTTFGRQPVYKERQQSAFAEASYSFNSQWTLGAGGRYLKDSIEAFNGANDGLIAGGPVPATPPIGGHSSVFNPSGYLRFKPDADTTYYLQAARGFRSPTANQPLSYDPNGPCAATVAQVGIGPLSRPDTLWTYELGSKWNWAQGRVQTNLAIFHQKWEGVQLTTSQPCALNGTVNGGNASGNGGELETTVRFSRSWTVNLSASYVHNKFVSVNPNLGYTVGSRISGAPEANASAGLQYNFSVGSGWNGFARADFTYVGGISYLFGTGASAVTLLQGGYGEANLRFSLERERFAVDLFARNVTNRYAAEATGDPHSDPYTYPIRPREIGVELRYSFTGPR